MLYQNKNRKFNVVKIGPEHVYWIFYSILSHFLCLQTNYFLAILDFKVQAIVFFKIASKIITLIMFLLKKKSFACYYYIVPSNYFPTAKITCMQNESNPTSVLPSVMTKWQHSPVKRHLEVSLIYSISRRHWTFL